MTLVDLQSGIAELGPRRAGHRFPAELRRELVAHVAAARQQGVAWATLAAQTGVRATSLMRMAAGGRRFSPQPALVPVVAVAPSLAVPGLCLHLPSGAEVRGLDLSTLVTLLQALA